jgi:hypothetical protein
MTDAILYVLCSVTLVMGCMYVRMYIPAGKEYSQSVPIGWETGWVLEPVSTLWKKRDKSFPCGELNLGLPVRRYRLSYPGS